MELWIPVSHSDSCYPEWLAGTHFIVLSLLETVVMTTNSVVDASWKKRIHSRIAELFSAKSFRSAQCRVVWNQIFSASDAHPDNLITLMMFLLLNNFQGTFERLISGSGNLISADGKLYSIHKCLLEQSSFFSLFHRRLFKIDREIIWAFFHSWQMISLSEIKSV